jgi:hypothetical protein
MQDVKWALIKDCCGTGANSCTTTVSSILRAGGFEGRFNPQHVRNFLSFWFVVLSMTYAVGAGITFLADYLPDSVVDHPLYDVKWAFAIWLIAVPPFSIYAYANAYGLDDCFGTRPDSGCLRPKSLWASLNDRVNRPTGDIVVRRCPTHAVAEGCQMVSHYNSPLSPAFIDNNAVRDNGFQEHVCASPPAQL